MKTKFHKLNTRGWALTAFDAALLAAITLFATSPRAPAQTERGSALSFDWGNNYVSASIPRLEHNYTVSAWVFLRARGEYWGTRLGVLSALSCQGSAEVLIHNLSDSSAPQYLHLGRCGEFDGINSTEPVPTNQWVHLAVTVSSDKQVNYFINGNAAGAWDAGALDLSLGPNITLADNTIRGFDGMLDEVRIWNVVRTQAEIAADMLDPLSGTEPGLVACYRFDENTGATAYDTTTSHLNGTLVNNPTWTWVGSTAPYPLTLQASGFTAITAGLNGLVNPNALETRAWFEWGTTISYGNTTTWLSPGSGSNSVPVSAPIGGLSPHVTYHYRMAASNSLGVAYGSDRTFSLAEGLVTTLADGGAGSLRQAIADAAPGTAILLTNTGTLTLTSGELVINKDLAIVGPGAATLAISGNSASRVFSIGAATVSISGLSIRNGKGANGGTGAPGEPGGGIYNQGALTLSDCVVSDNYAGTGGAGSAGTGDGGPGGAGGAGGAGGGIFNASTGELRMHRCLLAGNGSGSGGLGGAGSRGYDDVNTTGHAGGRGGAGGSAGAGAAIFSAGRLTMDQCTVTANNTGTAGGGGRGGDGGLHTGILPHWNGDGGPGGVGGAGSFGGGIYSDGSATLQDCTLSSNQSSRGGVGGNGGNGGRGFWTEGHGGAGGNGGGGGSGGNVYNNDRLTLFGCTIAGGAAGAGGAGGSRGTGNALNPNGTAGVSGQSGGIYTSGSAVQTSLANTIVALNTTSTGSLNDVFGLVSSLGHNLFGNTTGADGFAPSDLLNVDPVLGPLADNSGPFPTHTPLPGSPAINAGDNSYAPATDQRGLPRIADGLVDIGAVEFQYWPVVTTLPAGAVTSTGTVAYATLHGTVNPGGPMSTVAWFEWQDGVGLHQTAPLAVGGGTVDVAVSADLTGLTAGLIYPYRLIATNVLGFDQGDELRFCAPIGTLPAEVSSPTTARLSGWANPNGLETTAWFECGASTTYGSTTAAINLGGGTNAVPFSAEATGLTQGTWHYRVVISNSLGIVTGSDMTFTVEWEDQVVTIYFCGTGLMSDAYDASRSPWGDPELIATLYQADKSVDIEQGNWSELHGRWVNPTHSTDFPNPHNHHKYIVNGIGTSPGSTFFDVLARYLNQAKPEFGVRGWDAVLWEAKTALMVVKHSHPQGDYTVNLVGFSRGGVSTMMMARQLTDPDWDFVKKINILAYDPVPGIADPVAALGDNLSLGSKVQQYVGVYAQQELTYMFEPVIPELNWQTTKVAAVVLPGSHETMVGNLQQDGHSMTLELQHDDTRNTSLAYVGKVARVMAERLLTSPEWGSVDMTIDTSIAPGGGVDSYEEFAALITTMWSQNYSGLNRYGFYQAWGTYNKPFTALNRGYMLLAFDPLPFDYHSRLCYIYPARHNPEWIWYLPPFYFPPEMVFWLYQYVAPIDASAWNRLEMLRGIPAQDTEPPVPTVAVLDPVVGECPLVITTPPTAHDDVSGMIIGTTTDPLTYTAPGTNTITWTYTDANSNTATQTQVVIAGVVRPVIIQPPVSQSVVEGGDVTFSVAIIGYPAPFTYQWEHLSTVLTNIVAEERTGFYTLRNVQANQAGVYRVVIANLAVPDLSSNSPNETFTLTVLPDTDHDGLPEAWEAEHAVDDPNADPDHDAMTNRQECEAGTDPNNANSRLRIEPIEIGGFVHFEFLATSNKTYTIQMRNTADGGGWSKLADVVASATNRIVGVTDLPAGSSRFYRLVTPRQE